MAQFGRNTNGDTVQAFPLNGQTKEITATDVSCADLDVIRLLDDGSITVNMRDGSTVVVNAAAGEDFALTEDCISFSSTGSVRVA